MVMEAIWLSIQVSPAPSGPLRWVNEACFNAKRV